MEPSKNQKLYRLVSPSTDSLPHTSSLSSWVVPRFVRLGGNRYAASIVTVVGFDVAAFDRVDHELYT